MRKIIDLYFRFLKVVLTIFMGVLIVPVFLQIFSRYVGFIPRYIWTEELARFCFIWIILVGAMVAMRTNEHFTVDLLPTPKTNKGKAFSLMVVDFFTFLMAIIFLLWGWSFLQFGLLQTSEMADLPMGFIFVAWPLTGATWLLFLAERTVDNIILFRKVSP